MSREPRARFPLCHAIRSYRHPRNNTETWKTERLQRGCNTTAVRTQNPTGPGVWGATAMVAAADERTLRAHGSHCSEQAVGARGAIYILKSALYCNRSRSGCNQELYANRLVQQVTSRKSIHILLRQSPQRFQPVVGYTCGSRFKPAHGLTHTTISPRPTRTFVAWHNLSFRLDEPGPCGLLGNLCKRGHNNYFDHSVVFTVYSGNDTRGTEFHHTFIRRHVHLREFSCPPPPRHPGLQATLESNQATRSRNPYTLASKRGVRLTSGSWDPGRRVETRRRPSAHFCHNKCNAKTLFGTNTPEVIYQMSLVGDALHCIYCCRHAIDRAVRPVVRDALPATVRY